LSTTRLATRSGLFNQSPYLILDWIHHWFRKKPPSTLERTISSRSTTTGNQYLYDGRELFGRFRETTDEIARLQSKLREGRYPSNRIRRLYRQRTKRRDHAQNALVRDLAERLYDEGVATVYVGDLTDVLEAHWSVRVNEKTHNF